MERGCWEVVLLVLAFPGTLAVPAGRGLQLEQVVKWNSVQKERTLQASLLLSVQMVTHHGQEGRFVARQVHKKVVVGKTTKNNIVFGKTLKNNGINDKGTEKSSR
jgi:hypothetical protein